MSAVNVADDDPFADPVVEQDQQGFVGDSTLAVSRNASLTLGTDALIVLESTTTRAIPFYNVLWADFTKVDITIQYAKPTSKSDVRVAYIHYDLSPDQIDPAVVKAFVSRLLDRAYGSAQRLKRIKVLVNPYGGAGKAAKWYNRDIEPIFAAARCEVDVEKTQYMGHAVEIARALDIDSYDVIASCSGDGVPHEVFNGLAAKPDAGKALRTLAVVQLPCGTGNAMSWNLFGTDSPSMAALCLIKGVRTPLDLVSVTQGSKRTLSFLSQAVGIVAESDLGTEHIRWMGDARFTYGFLTRILRKTIYPADIAVKVEISGKAEIKNHYKKESQLKSENTDATTRQVSISLPSADIESDNTAAENLPKLKYGTVEAPLPDGWELIPYENLGNFYSGNMAYMAKDANFFPAALPHDGLMDLVTIDGDVPIMTSIKLLMSVEKGKFFDMPEVRIRKVSGYRIIPKNQTDGYISIDGERVPFEPFQCEAHRGLGTTLSKNGYLYEAKGVA
ncbi:MAG: hypothetical protein Q9227_005996 [Pyrenula ochraceoflavens]